MKRPQSLILHLSPLLSPSFPSSSRQPKTAYLGWSGLNAAANVSQVGDGVESVEVDPEVAMSLGWNEGILVSFQYRLRFIILIAVAFSGRDRCGT